MQIEVNRDGLVSIGCVNNHLCIQLTIILLHYSAFDFEAEDFCGLSVYFDSSVLYSTCFVMIELFSNDFDFK